MGPKVQQWLDDTGLGNSPAVLSALLEHALGASRMTTGEARTQLEQIKGNPKHKYWKGDKRYVEHVQMLAAIAYEGDDEVELPKTPMMKSGTHVAMERIEAEMAKVRGDRGYWDKSAPNHRALQARYGE
jgi:hypothetical protein